MENQTQYKTPGRKTFKWTFELTGDDVKDKRNMNIAFSKSLENFFNGPKPTSYNHKGPDRY